jgi:3-oxoadipate enol-lactonase
LTTFVEREGARLSYTVSGRSHAPALLLLNALGTSSEIWAPQLARLEKQFRVIRFDARGHGKSVLPDGPPAPCSMADLAADALAVLDAARVPRAHWCGVSLGGMVAMWVAAHHPERVQRLVLACTTAWMPPPEAWDERIAKVRAEGMAPMAEAVAGRWFTEGFRKQSPDVVERILAQVRATQPRGYAEACAAIRDMDQRGSLGSITAPALVIAGAQDPGTTLEHAEALVAGIAGSDLAVLDAAHLASVEQADDFTDTLIDFLRD